jgi:hypothetical protein
MWSWLQQYASGNASETATPHYCGVNIRFEMWSFTFQIDWKQRFFVPTDEDAGIAIVADLLTRYPILALADAESELTVTDAAPEVEPPQVVDLDTWIVAVRQAEPECQPWHRGTKSEPAEESATFALTTPAISVPQSNGNGAAQLALDFGLAIHE